MATGLTASFGQYRLLFVHPDPDNGERVCIGLILSEGAKNATLLFDPSLAKLRCIAPRYDFELLRFYLEDMRVQLHSSEGIETVLRRYGLTLSASEPRSAARDLSDAQKQILLERFAGNLAPQQTVMVAAQEEAAAKTVRPSNDERIKAFVQKSASHTRFRVFENAQPSDLFGYSPKKIRPVAVGLVSNSEVILVDGVDLNLMSPSRANSRTEQVVRTFWQYRRLQEERLTGKTLHRVGVVMNGSPTKTKAERDAHDYAIDLFQKESDLAVDASGKTGVNEFRDLLATRQ